MKSFITGGTGFIGTELVRRLQQTPHELCCLARQTSAVATLQALGAKIVRGDVTDKQSLLDGMKGCDWVVNLANLFEFWFPKRQVFEEVNVKGTQNVMEAALAVGAVKLVHVSTLAAYGDAEWPITETTALGARVPGDYARTKRAGEQLAQEFCTKHRLPLVVILPGAVMGANDPKAAGRYVKNLVLGKVPAQILTTSLFSFVHVRDVAEAIVRALEKDGNSGEKYLVVGENLTFGEINQMISEISGVKLPRFTFPDPVALVGAYVATGLANLFKKPPMLDMSIEQIRMMKHGFKVDASKATRDLGLSYTPIRTALEEAITHL